ncbi:16S rRNA (cytidine(1402)-2'-O)-methyltransferase [Helicobacter pametensis]|uniref:16S rRNA (cytidine(1402)-2'-O)-methyltransferase n=1 Tax=Helicobacter pametensis TaxID=95149 RepID=UPI0004838B54|nr:16S rRNA (cytidine(1402)-2'-O)-methyltransferase [Helicobacter pametensis]
MLYLLPTPIGNLADVTLRTLRVLQSCDKLLCEDTRITQKLLMLLEQQGLLPKKQRELFSFHSHNQESFLSRMTPSFFDQDIAFLSDAGMPCVSDPGSALVRYAQDHQIPYEVLLGGSAVVLAHAYSGFGDHGFVFDGFLPTKSAERQERFAFWRDVLPHRGISLIVFESPHRLRESLEDLGRIDENCYVFAIKEMTKKFETSFCGFASEILDSLDQGKILGEWVLVLRFSSKEDERKLGKVDILQADLPPKLKAKLLAKITGDETKEWYQKLMEQR